MRKLMRFGAGLALLAVGYFLGSQGFLETRPVQAQAPPIGGQGLDKDAQAKLKTANEALVAARRSLDERRPL